MSHISPGARHCSPPLCSSSTILASTWEPGPKREELYTKKKAVNGNCSGLPTTWPCSGRRVG